MKNNSRKLHYVLKECKNNKVEYKVVPTEYTSTLVLYPDNYENDGVYFKAYTFYDNTDECEAVFEDSNGTEYNFGLKDFLNFVKNFKLNNF